MHRRGRGYRHNQAAIRGACERCKRAFDCAPVKAEDAPTTVERMLKAYLAHRASERETFAAFTRRHEVDALKAMFEREAVE